MPYAGDIWFEVSGHVDELEPEDVIKWLDEYAETSQIEALIGYMKRENYFPFQIKTMEDEKKLELLVRIWKRSSLSEIEHQFPEHKI